MHRFMLFCRIPICFTLSLCFVLANTQACSPEEESHTRLNQLEERIVRNLRSPDSAAALDALAGGGVKKRLGQAAEALRRHAVHTRLENGDDAYDMDGMRYIISNNDDAIVVRASSINGSENFLTMHVAAQAGEIMLDAKQYMAALESFGYGSAGEAFGQMHVSYDATAGKEKWAMKASEGLRLHSDEIDFDLDPSPELVTVTSKIGHEKGCITVKLGALSYTSPPQGEQLHVPSMHFVLREQSDNETVLEGLHVSSPVVRITRGRKTTVTFDRTFSAMVKSSAQKDSALITSNQAGSVRWAIEGVTDTQLPENYAVHWTRGAAIGAQSMGRQKSFKVARGSVTVRSPGKEKILKSGDVIFDPFTQR